MQPEQIFFITVFVSVLLSFVVLFKFNKLDKNKPYATKDYINE